MHNNYAWIYIHVHGRQVNKLVGIYTFYRNSLIIMIACNLHTHSVYVCVHPALVGFLNKVFSEVY
jgi:hypothetical protein